MSIFDFDPYTKRAVLQRVKVYRIRRKSKFIARHDAPLPYLEPWDWGLDARLMSDFRASIVWQARKPEKYL